MKRFWDKVDIRGPDECWEWMAAKTGDYGSFSFHGKSPTAHRVAWELTNGPIPPRHCVCHRCDNPPCVNPAHLFLGTIADNNHDMIRKGRYRRSHGRATRIAKLSFTQAQEIRCLYYSYLYERLRRIRGRRALAQRFEVNESTIKRIIDGRTYRGPNQDSRGNPKLTAVNAQIIQDIYTSHRPDFHRKALANKYGVSPQTIDRVVRLKGYLKPDGIWPRQTKGEINGN